ncbi:hypothetical protein, partial [Bacillus thuringiensis]|uniref:hypothetical protein n=1 Tax=Bacillus thuringiensis TaxID=1428 RepID=UPI0021AAE59B
AAGAEVVEIAGFTRPEVLAGIDAFWRARSLGDFEQLSADDQAAILPYVARWCTGARGVDAARTVQNYQRFADLAQATR